MAGNFAIKYSLVKMLSLIYDTLSKQFLLFRYIFKHLCLFSDNEEKPQDQYMENSHLTSSPHWVNNNSLGKFNFNNHSIKI